MKINQICLLPLCVALFTLSSSIGLSKEETHTYKGSWRGKPVMVSIIWKNFGGNDDIEGTIYDRVSRKAHPFTGINLRPGYIEFGFADDNYKLSSTEKNGQIIWKGGPGDSLTFSRKGAKGGVTTGQPPVNMPRPVTPPNMPRPVPPKEPPYLPRPVQELTMEPIVWPVGKWPEGIATDGRNFWVAESGQRTLAQLDLDNGSVLKRVNSGRLPVGLVNFRNESIFSVVATDQKLIRYNQAGNGGTFSSIPEYPNDITSDDNAVWVVMWINDTDSAAQVIRYDPDSGATTKSGILGSSAADVIRAGKWLWVSHASGKESSLDVLEPNGLQQLPSVPLNGHFSALAGNEHSVYVAGGEWDVRGEIVRVDPGQMQEVARQQLPGEFIYRVTADSDHVVAVGYHGTIWVMSAHDLSIEKVIRLTWGQYTPASVMLLGESIFITTHLGNGENGSVLKIPEVIEGGHP